MGKTNEDSVWTWVPELWRMNPIQGTKDSTKEVGTRLKEVSIGPGTSF